VEKTMGGPVLPEDETNSAAMLSIAGLSPRLASLEMEEKFRAEHLPEDLRTTKFLAVITASIVVSFFLIDWRFRGLSHIFFVLMGTRLVILLSTAVLLLRLRRAISPLLLERWLLAWISVAMLLGIYSLYTRSAAEAVPMSILLILIASLIIPMRFSFQAWTATVAVFVIVSVFAGQKPTGYLLSAGMVTLTGSLLVGLIVSRKLHRSRREAFVARQLERETVKKLEAALAEVKQLEEILPICSACKKIRREDDGWTPLDEYISEHSDTRFSHGICPECAATLYPEQARRPRE
jgi:hypothetical protein